MFAMTEAKPHGERRRMLAHVYSKSYVQHSTALANILDVVLLERMLPELQKLGKGETREVHADNKAYATDVVTSYFFGLSNGTNLLQEAEAKERYCEAFCLAMSAMFWMTECPKLTLWLRGYGIKLFPDKVFASFQMLEDLCTRSCQDAQRTMQHAKHEEGPGSDDWPTVYAQLRKKLEDASPRPEPIDDIIAAEMLDHLQASHEAVGITITYLMYEISKKPARQRQLRDSFLKLPRQGLKLPSAQDLDALPLLDAMLMETMRLYPAGLGPFTRLVPSNGAKLGDFSDIPAGTTVSTTAYALHRNEAAFPNASEWRPERWLGDKDQHYDMQKWFWAFGSGSRMCIGNHLAIRSKPYSFEILISGTHASYLQSSNLACLQSILVSRLG